MIETLERRIRRHEGFVHVPKPDAKGMYVIGYGHDITPDQAQDYANGISETDAESLLEQDITKAEAALASDLPWALNLSQIKQDVLVEMIFQMGVDGLMTFHNLLFNARQGNDAAVAQSMLNSLWHSQTPTRCEELASLWVNGDVDA